MLEVVKPNHIRAYREELKRLRDGQGAVNEGSLRIAFHNLLSGVAKKLNWTLIDEYEYKVNEKRSVYPDGTLKDEHRFPRGYWEAKDSQDDLDTEINKKTRIGYPRINTIFEDTKTAVLIQDSWEVMRVSISDIEGLSKLLTIFFSYEAPPHAKFKIAVEEFKTTIPELALGLNGKIKEAHENNPNFTKTFESFFDLCKNSLNSNISQDAIDEMIIQHILTERLINRIFEYSEFQSRNIIACELDKVINAMASQSFSKEKYLAKLDQFYKAIEEAAAFIENFNDKQFFLNTVYERFFQGYSVKVADTHGIVYTPPEIVDFMCNSVVEILRSDLGKEIYDPYVNIIDPCTGTGSFIAKLLHLIPQNKLDTMYDQQIFANEVMLMPYYIASLNIEHTYSELSPDNSYKPFEGLCFVDTLDLVGGKPMDMYFSQPNTERINRQWDTQITVVIGNPPYNMGQQNENDNNKNRTYEIIDKRVQNTYTKDSTATLRNKLYDPYVKFFRWATDRLKGRDGKDRDGIVCFVSNNGFLQGMAFDGFRKHLLKDFTTIYHFDFKGNARTSGERRRREGGNIFSDLIRVGVGITLLVRNKQNKEKKLLYHAVGDYWKAEKKKEYLNSFKSVSDVPWKTLIPDNRNAWIVPENVEQFGVFVPIGTKEAKSNKGINSQVIFRIYSLGIATNRDDCVYDFCRDRLANKAEVFTNLYNGALGIYQGAKGRSTIDSLIDPKDTRIKWTRQVKKSITQFRMSEFDPGHIRKSIYRPYAHKYLYFDNFWIEERYLQYLIFPTETTESENMAICLSGIGQSKPFTALISNIIPCLDLIEKTQCFPYYIYNKDGSTRHENITDWALQHFRDHYQDQSITKWDIFYYVYGLLHHPQYRSDFADNLKRDLPRIPLAPDFRAFAESGQKLANLHLNYEQLSGYNLKDDWSGPIDYTVKDKMRLSKDKTALTVNPSFTLQGIPPETFEYRLGNRSALDWVIDQYRVKQDMDGKVISDPNRHDNKEYIVKLVKQVVQVSLDTVAIVKGLPKEYS